MADSKLPSAFAEFEKFTEWCLPTERERYDKRLSSTMQEMGAFYDAFFPHLEEAIEYCDKFPLDDLPEDVEHLLQLIYSLIMVSMAVEIFKQPKAVDAADAVLDRIGEPVP
jgi:hypothetical protein